MGLGAQGIVLTAGAAQALQNLEASSDPTMASVARRVRALRPLLLTDCLHGEVVKKDRIRRELRAQHGLETLYVEDLPSFHRLLYTVVRDRGERFIVIIEIVDHGRYSRWFPGRRR